MRFKQIIVSIFLVLIVTNSCNLEKQNKYVFPNEENARYFIVNMHNANGIKTRSVKDTFDFSNSRLIVLNNRDVSAGGLFFIKINGKVVSFNPNETDENKFKLCYFQNIKNVGFSLPYYSVKFGIKPLELYENLDLEYDYLYFKIGKTCKSDSISYNEDLRRLLVTFFAQRRE